MSPRLRWALLALAAGGAGFAVWRASRSSPAALPVETPGPRPSGTARVALIDDGVRVAAADGMKAFLDGHEIWRPGEPLRLLALPGETIAFQVVVTAGDETLRGIEVSIDPLRQGEVALHAETFVLAELNMLRRSGGAEPGASLGWALGAAPPGPAPGGALPDPLIPRDWLNAKTPARPGVVPNDFPMTVPAGHHRVVWFDVFVPPEAMPGHYEGRVKVTGQPDLRVEVEVGSTPLPYRALPNMLFFEPTTIERVVGPEAVDLTLQRLHRHHLAPIVPLRSLEEVERFMPMLDGSLFTEERGYDGPGVGVPSDVVVIGAYGSLREPTPAKLDAVDSMLARLEQAGLYREDGSPDVFLYAVDEECDSSRGPDWRAALDASERPRLRRLRVGHTCSEPPASQPVDIAMVFAGAFDPALAAAAQAEGKAVWIYNGELPRTGSFLTDAWPLSLRINGWIQAHHGIARWFFWEGAYWTDDNAGGHGPYDPWLGAETFHNQHGDHANGDGVLLYPGRQEVASERYQLGVADTAPSFRLKQWRRGLQDGAYLHLARRVDASAAEAISSPLVQKAFSAGEKPAFPTTAAPYRAARRALFELIEGQRDSD